MPQVFKIGSYWVYFWTNEKFCLERCGAFKTDMSDRK